MADLTDARRDGPNRPDLADLIPLDEVCRRLPTRTHRSTVYRWAQRGRRGVRLRAVTVGATRCTTEAWLMEFFEAVERTRTVASTTPTPTRSPSASRGRQGRTNATLRRHGLAPDEPTD